MRAFMGELDRTSLIVLVVGLAVGAAWIVSLPAGLILTGVALPIGAIILVIGRRWLEVGLLLAAVGVVPSVAYRVFGPPPLPVPMPEAFTPPETLAPGGASFLLLVGMIVVVVAASGEMRHGRRRQRQEREHARRKGQRLGDTTP